MKIIKKNYSKYENNRVILALLLSFTLTKSLFCFRKFIINVLILFFFKYLKYISDFFPLFSSEYV
jgi:hypothetical protein